MNKIKTALISVCDKTNIIDLAQFLIEKNIKTAVDSIKEDIMIAQIVSENTVQQYKLIK